LRIGSGVDTETGLVRLVFSDTGGGIPEENLDHIYDPFFTTKGEGKGTGLGLSIVYGVVKGHGGKVHVQSKVDEGTTFTLTFPRISARDVCCSGGI